MIDLGTTSAAISATWKVLCTLHHRLVVADSVSGVHQQILSIFGSIAMSLLQDRVGADDA